VPEKAIVTKEYKAAKERDATHAASRSGFMLPVT